MFYNICVFKKKKLYEILKYSGFIIIKGYKVVITNSLSRKMIFKNASTARVISRRLNTTSFTQRINDT